MLPHRALLLQWVIDSIETREFAADRERAMNKLWFGDNLNVMRHRLKDETVDLIYLDPPFNSQSNYNLVFPASKGRGHRAQVQAFEDTWTWGEDAEKTYEDLLEVRGPLCLYMQAWRASLGNSDLMAYLVMMAVRLVEMHRILKPIGSLYLHCDPNAGGYLRNMLDAIFGITSFRTEISWRRQSAHNDAKQGRRQPGNVRDTIFFYTKGDRWTWNTQYTPYDQSYVDDFYRHTDPVSGRRYRLSDLTGPGGAEKGNPRYEVMGVTRYWRFTETKMAELIAEGRVVQTKPGAVPAQKRYLDEMPGVALQNDWTDIKPASGREFIGYATQKPLALLERIIACSTNPGDLVLDPFCGCGTAVHAAQKLGRNWIGIDITHVAIHVIADRLDRWTPGAKFKIEGQPTDLAGAFELATINKFQFQWWATWLCGGQPYGGERVGKDYGIDGTLEFVSRRGEHDWGVISVKGGKTVGVAAIRDLRGTMEREGAPIGVLLCLAKPTRDMEQEALSAGTVTLGGERYRRIQIRTIEQLFAGEAIACPYLLTTVQAPPGRASGGSKRVAMSPLELQKQRSFLYPLQGGKTEAEPDLFGHVPAEKGHRRHA